MSAPAPARRNMNGDAEVRLPIDLNGAINALQFGTVGVTAGAILGALMLPAAPVEVAVAAPVLATLGLGALGYRLARKA